MFQHTLHTKLLLPLKNLGYTIGDNEVLPNPSHFNEQKKLVTQALWLKGSMVNQPLLFWQSDWLESLTPIDTAAYSTRI